MVDTSRVLWDDTGPYQLDGSKKSYLAPFAAAQYQGDPRVREWAKSKGASIDYTSANPAATAVTGRPDGNFFRQGGTWNSESGRYDQPLDYGNLLSLGIGATMAAPFVASAFGAGAGGTGAGSAAATGTASGALPSTTIGTGMMAGLPAGGAGITAGGSGGMGFLSALKGFGKDLLFDTAKDAAGNVLSTRAGDVGQTAGSIEQGRMQGLIQQAMLQQRQDENAQARAKLALTAPGAEASNSVRGDILANSQDASFSGLPSYIHKPEITGGLRPSMLSANSRQLGGNMSRNALMNNLSGKDVPDLTPLPEANAFDTGLQATALGGGFLNALRGGSKQTPTGPASTIPDPGVGQDGVPNSLAAPNPMPLPAGTADMGMGDTGLSPGFLEFLKRQQQGDEANA